MSERKTHILLGAFILGGVAIAIASFLFMAGQSYNDANSHHVVMVFDGSVTGLNKGAPVAIRGADIGQVTDIRVRFVQGDSGLSLLMEVEAIINEASVAREAQTEHIIGQELIDAGLRAQLNNLSLVTGLLYIQLDFVPDSEARLLAQDSGMFEIPTIPSPFQQFVKDIDRLNLPRLASDMQAIAKSLKAFTGSEAFQALPNNANLALASTARITGELEGLLARLEPQIEQTLASTTSAAKTTEMELPLIAQDLRQSLATLNETLETFTTLGKDVNLLFEQDSPTVTNLNTTLAEIARASRSLNTLARSLEEQPQSLILGRPGGEE